MSPSQRSKKRKTASAFPDCAMCNNPATLSCSSCHCRNLYCSKSCQRADEKLHKVLCSSRPSFETPPTGSSRRAIVFLTNGEIKFTWITTEMVTDHGTIYESPVGIEKYFVGQYPAIQSYYNNIVRGRRLKDKIDLRFNDDFLSDGSEKNLAVCRVVEGMDDGGAVWRASLVALKETRSWVDNQRLVSNPTPGYGHMDMGDLREVVDYLTNWKRETAGWKYPTRPQYSDQCFFLSVFLFYLLACGALSTLTYHLGPVRSRDNLVPWSLVKALVRSSTQG